jgi:glycosyltransferase involved in cell wall biosynthesis
MTRSEERPLSLVVYLPDLSGGGAENLHVRLAPEFLSAGCSVTFLLAHESGELLRQVPVGCQIKSLGAERQIKALPKLIRFLRQVRPDVLIANTEHMNVISIVARCLARVPTRIIAIQHNTFSEQVKRRSLGFRILPMLYRLVLPFADAIVAVSAGVADDLAKRVPLSRDVVSVVYNGVITAEFDERVSEQIRHPWFADGKPVILGMGRMVPQKDFVTLIRAFAAVERKCNGRLMILGNGPMQNELEQLVKSLGLLGRVEFPGYIDNPLPYLRHADLFVLSSRFEGFGNVIAEALACGTPVVSTDCPHGPAEILADGRYGDLVPVGNWDALGEAILSTLARPPDHHILQQRGRAFSVTTCAASYVELIRRMTQRSAGSTSI